MSLQLFKSTAELSNNVKVTKLPHKSNPHTEVQTTVYKIERSGSIFQFNGIRLINRGSIISRRQQFLIDGSYLAKKAFFRRLDSLSS